MEPLQFLLTRRSCGKLVAPAPCGEARANLFRAAVNVPDHGRLRPWRFITAEGENLQRLGDILAAAEQTRGGDEAAVARARLLPSRAPLVVMVVARLKPHDKVPPWEQQAAAICAAHALQMAAAAQGFGAIWRTGYFARDAGVAAALQLAQGESLVGFIYIGTPLEQMAQPPLQDLAQLVSALP